MLYMKFYQPLVVIIFLQWVIYHAVITFLLEKGPYDVIWNEIGPCDEAACGSQEIQLNFHLDRKFKNETRISGNVTLLVPLDDSIRMHILFWKFHHERGWQKSGLNLKLNHACSDFLTLFTDQWTILWNHVPRKCPIATGVYIHEGFNADAVIARSMLPAQFMYGRYKVLIPYVRKKTGRTLGCVKVVLKFNPQLFAFGKL